MKRVGSGCLRIGEYAGVRLWGGRRRRLIGALPGRIEELEGTIAELQQAMADPALYRDRSEEVPALKARLDGAEAELADAFERWAELDD